MGVGVTVGVGVSVGVGLAVLVGVWEGVAVGVSVADGALVAVAVGVMVAVGSGVTASIDGVVSSVAPIGGAPKEPLPALEMVGRGVRLSVERVSVRTAVASSISSGAVMAVAWATGVVETAVSGKDPRGTPAKKKPKARSNKAKPYPVNMRARKSSREPSSRIRASVLGDCASRASPIISRALSPEMPIPHKVHSGKPIVSVVSDR